MTYEDWIKHCEKVILQYNEGAIFASEAFNSIINKAIDVEQKHQCLVCGVEIAPELEICGNHNDTGE